MNNKGYTGIDVFRIVAAVLVVAIHTSPLAEISQDADFIFTRILARVAVPFFFMASGFFFMESYGERNVQMVQFIKKTAKIYGAAILLYLPLNIYKGDFFTDFTLEGLLKDVLVDGTFYHLWYLPAVIVGMALAWQIVRRFTPYGALLLSGILYVIGLFGDSYYGLLNEIPLFEGFYENIFEICEYTRNGLFFAPIFVVFGMLISRQERKADARKQSTYLVGFLFGLSLMVCEGMVLHWLDFQRHDSMYLMLPIVMYFGFRFLCGFKQGRIKGISNISLFVYIIHPAVIVGLRMVDKVLGIKLFSANNMAQFVGTVIVSFSLACLWVRIKPNKKTNPVTDRAWVEIDLENLESNVREIKSILQSGCKFMAVVKADAYGHGAVIVAQALNNMGVDSFAVATIDEGIVLRKNGIVGEILILDYTTAARVREIKKYNLIQTVVDYEHAKALNDEGCRIKVHIKIDTGMKRLGMDADDVDSLVKAFAMKNLDICGMYTHLSVTDSKKGRDIEFTRKQETAFTHLLEELKRQKIEVPKIHLQSSYGVLNYPGMKADYARIGIAMYGTLSSKDDRVRSKVNLKQVLSLKSQVVLVRNVRAGEGVGYGRDFVADKDARIAVVSIGYGDGVPRNLSTGCGRVLIAGRYAPIVGRICMDQLMVDVTEIEGVLAGCEVVLIGKMQDMEISLTDFANDAGSIANEVLSRLGKRIQVVQR